MQRLEGVKIETKGQNKQPYCFAFASFKTRPELISQFLYLVVLRFIFILNFAYLCVCLCGWVCVYVCRWPKSPEEAIRSLGAGVGAGNQIQGLCGAVCTLTC